MTNNHPRTTTEADALRVALARLIEMIDAYTQSPVMAALQEHITMRQARAALASAAQSAPAAPAKPLTSEQLQHLHHIEEFGLFCDRDEFEDMARAIEYAHGIGTTPPAQGDALVALIEHYGRVEFQRYRVGPSESLTRWDIELGHYDLTVSGATLPAAIAAAAIAVGPTQGN